jgi:hypothetical protein
MMNEEKKELQNWNGTVVSKMKQNIGLKRSLYTITSISFQGQQSSS